MDRRSFIKEGSISLGGISLGLLTINSCQSREASAYNELLSAEEVNLINELGEIIIPATDTPGARAAKVGEFIAVIVRDCYSDAEQKEFKDTFEYINKISGDSYGKSFLKCDEKDRMSLVTKLEKEHEGYKSLKNQIVSAYLSSEIGTTQFFTYHPVPGKYEGCTSVRPW